MGNLKIFKGDLIYHLKCSWSSQGMCGVEVLVLQRHTFLDYSKRMSSVQECILVTLATKVNL